MIEERIVENPNRRRIVKVSNPSNTDSNFIADITIEDEGSVTQSGTLITAELLGSLAYPVGAIYISTVNICPASFFGGNWTRWGQGRVPLGMGQDGGTEFTIVEAKGGAETHVLTIEQMPKHSHRQTVAAANYAFPAAFTSGIEPNYSTTNSYQDFVSTSQRTTGHEIWTLETGSGIAHNILQPYVTCYMWKRIG